ncbi:endolytic transglycosylase MltG [Sporolactobacillus shoreicorticis]|uniref:Endolytic murein transglycosylase n=1 Tax=Sporolactobacillus shoreicorticis TaxID=1923877 RepID=A0ABW5S5X1_9BACL|nr:endolytic transglycosylase MltG [Sporolactobacillus shoreicorticis]MCO7126379.1 endolytic transglycosylase MltG [Sporolactobacillus shoreicorticis]
MIKKHWRLLSAITIILIAMIAGAAWGFNRYYASLLTPVNQKNNQSISVNIPSGASVKDIGRILEDKGLVRKAWAFEFYARWNHLNNYRSGTYVFNQTMSAGQLMNDLENGKRHERILLVDVRQGMWVSEIAQQMATVANLDKKDILKKLSDHTYVKAHYAGKYTFLTDEVFAKGIKYPLEGYLAPGNYRFKVTSKTPLTLDRMIDQMLDQTERTYKSYGSQIKVNKLGSFHKILAMASLVEQEAPKDKDRRLIAGVFYNRLEQKKRLESDTTVIYNRQKRNRDYTLKDIRKDTPYNTYTRTGLPVGPIGAPARDAIEAVLNPTASKNLFFYARPNGKIYYSKTYQEHQAIVAKYQREWSEKS